jgi:hypothetical protein
MAVSTTLYTPYPPNPFTGTILTYSNPAFFGYYEFTKKIHCVDPLSHFGCYRPGLQPG